MTFVFDERQAESEFVDLIWHTRSESGGKFTSVAVTQWEMVITKQSGITTFTIRGPESHATPAPIPSDAEFIGITFTLGAFMPKLPPKTLIDTGIHLPGASGNGFWLNSGRCEVPNYENADDFIKRLVHEDLLVFDPIIASVLENQPQDLSVRSIQRRFLHATGLTYKTIQQINRAHEAIFLLEQGVSILDTAFYLGYSDQAHLTRSLKKFMGQTPTHITPLSPLG